MHRCTGGPYCCRCAQLIQKWATIMVASAENNKMLNGSADDLSSLLAFTHYLHVGLWCGPSALWSCSKTLKDVQFSTVAGTDRHLWCSDLPPHTDPESEGPWPKTPLPL